MWLFIEPIDVWLFRDGKPFTGGEDRVAHSLFPPAPFTLQGSIRAKILTESGIDLEDYAKGANCSKPLTRQVGEQIGFPGAGYGKLQLRGPFLARRNGGRVEFYFPVPADLRQAKLADSPSKTIVLAPRQRLPFITSTTGMPQLSKFCPLWAKDIHPVKQPRGWLSQQAMEKYLDMQHENLEVIADSDLFEFESRFGISVDSSRKGAEEGMLYQAEFVRLKPDVGLLVSVDGVSLPSQGILALGGERRAAKYEVVNVDPDFSHVGEAARGEATAQGRFKLVLTTPAYFRSGWLPFSFERFFSGGSVELVSAAIPEPINIGGAKVDIESQRRGAFHRPMYCFVPAGAVYFFEAKDKVTVTGEPFTESPSDEDLSKIGFGQFLIGRWDYV